MAAESMESLPNEIISGDLFLLRLLLLDCSGDRMGMLGGAHDDEPEGEPVEDQRLRRIGGAGHGSRCSLLVLIIGLVTEVVAVAETQQGARM
jgi:hypothetical protein